MLRSEDLVLAVAEQGDWLFSARLTSADDAVIREELHRRIRKIGLQVLEGERGAFAEAERVVATLARWLRETPRFLLDAVHNHAARIGVRSHALAVSSLMMNFAIELGHDLEHVLDLGVAGLFHDVGKLSVAEGILDKPGRLNSRELAIMRRHADDGARMLERCGGASPLTIAICRHHHERIDGTGYPMGLSGAAVTVPMRMAAICDVYDALISSRVYKAPWEKDRALAEMRRGAAFDPELLEIFAKSLGRLS